MEIGQTNSALTPAIKSPDAQTTASSMATDFETFLKMLTAQAKYQDPLEPLDSSEYASQLAQFSSVEQQLRTNDLLVAMGDQLGTNQMAQFAGWIGMEARTNAPMVFDGTPITINPNPAATATSMQLVIYDSRGAEVQRETIPVSDEPIVWAGVAGDGSPFETGTYRFEVESYLNETLLVSEPVSNYARVLETRIENGQTIMILENGEAVTSTDVTALREAI